MKKINLAILIVASLLCSCEMSDQKSNGSIGQQTTENFSFETQRNIDIQADFGPMSINGLVQVFTSDPTQYITEGGKIVDSYVEGEAVYNTYANQDGRVEGNFVLPDYVKKVWVSVHAIGVGGTMECDVENGHIRLDAAKIAPRRNAAMASKPAQYELFDLPSGRLSAPAGWTNFKTLVKWWNGSEVSQYGKVISDPNDLIRWDGAAYTEKAPIDYSDLHLLLKALWKGNDSKPTGLNNSNLCVKDVSLVNTTIHAKGEKKSTKLWFRFLDEHAWNQNVMGYYYYPEGQEASLNKETMKKYIIIPNASKPNHYPFCKPTNNAPYEMAYAPTQSGMSIQLLFEDPVTGEISEEFPAGYTVGFFCIGDGFNVNNSRINATASNTLFSNDAFNANNRSRFICLAMNSNNKDYLVYGLEDSGVSDQSYEDILFVIDAEEPDLIQEPNRTTIDEITSEYAPTTQEHSYYTYAYEDNYEDIRDYDLNDMVIEHHRMYESKKDQLQKQATTVIDYFTLECCDAEFDNAFAFQYAKAYSEQGSNGVSIKFEASKNGADWTTWSLKEKYNWNTTNGNNLRTYVLFNSKGLNGNKYFRVIRTFKNAVATDDIRDAETSIWPFIIPKWNIFGSKKAWSEIHLPNDEVTPLATNKEIGTDAFHFVDAHSVPGMLFPYAIRLTQTKTERFVPSVEGVRIDHTYPSYVEWVKSKGMNAKDWYKK